MKITVAEGLLDTDRVSYFNLTVADPDGRLQTARMPTDVYLTVVAATNMKQRTRKLLEYTHADARNYAGAGHAQPARVRARASSCGAATDWPTSSPSAICTRPRCTRWPPTWACPTTSAGSCPAPTRTASRRPRRSSTSPCPTAEMDLLLWAWHHDVPPDGAAGVVGLRPDQVERVYRDIVAKRRAAERGLRDAIPVEHVDLGPGAGARPGVSVDVEPPAIRPLVPARRGRSDEGPRPLPGRHRPLLAPADADDLPPSSCARSGRRRARSTRPARPGCSTATRAGTPGDDARHVGVPPRRRRGRASRPRSRSTCRSAPSSAGRRGAST